MTFAVDFSHKKKQFILGFLFSKPVKVTLGKSIRKTFLIKRRPSTKQRPKKLKQKYYYRTSRKVLYATLRKNRYSNIYIFALEMRLLVTIANKVFFRHKATVSLILSFLNVNQAGIRTQKALQGFVGITPRSPNFFLFQVQLTNYFHARTH